MLIAPLRKHLILCTFVFNVGSGNLHDIVHAKQPQLASLPCGCILVREPPADELEVFVTRRVGKNCNSRRYTAFYEVRCLERTRTAGIKRYNDDIGGSDWVADHERPSGGSQNRRPNRGNSDDGSPGQCDHH